MPELSAGLRAIAISGSPRAPSKSKLLAEMLLQAFEKAGGTTCMIDVAEPPAEALLAREPSQAIDDAITAVGEARIVYGGRGTLARSNAMGWLGRFFNSAAFPY